jgi:hypothetical protein
MISPFNFRILSHSNFLCLHNGRAVTELIYKIGFETRRKDEGLFGSKYAFNALKKGPFWPQKLNWPLALRATIPITASADQPN